MSKPVKSAHSTTYSWTRPPVALSMLSFSSSILSTISTRCLGVLKLIVDTQKYKIHPELSVKDVQDLSPAVGQIVETMKALRQREAKVAKKRPVDPTVA